MLPPGHVAGGFLATYGLLKVVKPDLDPSQINHLLVLGAFFGFAPDLDYFWSFAKEKSFTVRDYKKNSHRKLLSHAPLLWLAASLLIYLLADSTFVKFAGLTLWAGSWSHFLLDTLEYGIMWLWPFSKRKVYLKFQGEQHITEPGFWRFWIRFVKIYTGTISFYAEILIILIAFIIYLKI